MCLSGHGPWAILQSVGARLSGVQLPVDDAARDSGEQADTPSRWSRIIRVLLILGLVAALLAVPIGFLWHGFLDWNHHKAVPASAFPRIDGVKVLSTGVPVPVVSGDSGAGDRRLVVTAPGLKGAAAFDLVTNGLISSGWEEIDCRNGPSPSRCFQTPDYWAIVGYPATHNNRRLNVLIEQGP